jgi:hypothetical protein
LFQLMSWPLVSSASYLNTKLTHILVLNPSVKFEWFKINDPAFQLTARGVLIDAVGIYHYIELNYINITFYSLNLTVLQKAIKAQSLKPLDRVSPRIKKPYRFLDCQLALQP